MPAPDRDSRAAFRFSSANLVLFGSAAERATSRPSSRARVPACKPKPSVRPRGTRMTMRARGSGMRGPLEVIKRVGRSRCIARSKSARTSG